MRCSNIHRARRKRYIDNLSILILLAANNSSSSRFFPFIPRIPLLMGVAHTNHILRCWLRRVIEGLWLGLELLLWVVIIATSLVISTTNILRFIVLLPHTTILPWKVASTTLISVVTSSLVVGIASCSTGAWIECSIICVETWWLLRCWCWWVIASSGWWWCWSECCGWGLWDVRISWLPTWDGGAHLWTWAVWGKRWCVWIHCTVEKELG